MVEYGVHDCNTHNQGNPHQMITFEVLTPVETFSSVELSFFKLLKYSSETPHPNFGAAVLYLAVDAI